MKIFETSLRMQLFVMAVIIALPAAGILLYSGLETRREALVHAGLEAQALADGIAHRQQSLVAAARQLLNGLAQLPDIRHHDVAKVQAILTDILTANPQYLNIFIVDRRGVMWVSAVPSTSPIPIADRRHFINAMATGRFSSGECIIGRLLRKPTISFGYPFKAETGEIAGLIVVNFDLGYCDQLLESARLPAGSSFLLTDYKGIILGRGINPALFLGKPLEPEMFRQMQQGTENETFLSTSALDGVRRLAAYRKLYLEGEDTPYMYVRTGIPIDAVLARANTSLLLNLGLLSTVLLLGFAAAWVLGKRSIVARVEKLQGASRQLAEGDFRVRVAEAVQGGELGSLAASFDAMAAALQRQQSALLAKALMLENMAEGVSECDGSGNILFTNPAFDAMLGYPRGELTGTAMHALLADAERDGDLCQRIVRHLQERPLWCGELHNRKKDGTTVHTYARISRIPGTDSYITVQEDIGERKNLERMRDEMIAAISHDMRTPLTALLGFHEYLQENAVDAATLNDALATMYKETLRLDEMIGNFLDLQRINAERMTYDFGPVAVEALLRETAALFANASRNHRIVVNTPADLPPVWGDETRLHQVLNNLVSNAIKYSPRRCDIVLGATRAGNCIILSVRDGGIGIPAEARERIFERFYRVNHAGSFHAPGSGLGLALVKEVVDAHGGNVQVESTPGEGSTFFVSLPIACLDQALAN